MPRLKKEDIKGVPFSKNQPMLMLLFANDQVIIPNTEDNLQKAAYKLNKIIPEHGLTIPVQKTKLMAFRGQDPVRSKIVIDNKNIEEVNSFNNLGHLICYEQETETDNKLNYYLKITGIINNYVTFTENFKEKNKTIQYTSPSSSTIQ